MKILSPTLHLYYYVLRNSLNESSEALKSRRDFFSKNLHKLIAYLSNKDDLAQLIPFEQDLANSGTLIDFSTVPPKYQKPQDDRLHFEKGIINSRLAVRRLNDSYLLRFTTYVSSTQGEQPIKLYENLSERLSSLQVELGKTVILAGIAELPALPESRLSIVADCLNCYYPEKILPEKIIENDFLGSPFFLYPTTVTVKQKDEFSVESIELACLFFYKDQATEQKADLVYGIFQYLLLSYHKINFFYSQSRVLKKILTRQYEAIERQTEDYAQQKWDSQSLKKLPQDSLQYHKNLSFLEDQIRLVEVNCKNYQECLQQIKLKTGHNAPLFLTDFQKEAEFYLEQMKADIGFLNPALQLFEKFMLSVQTQVSIDETAAQKELNLRQARIGQILAGAGTGIALGKWVTEPITLTWSQQVIDRGKAQPSLTSLWLGAGCSIFLSIIIGYLISLIAYRWLIKDQYMNRLEVGNRKILTVNLRR